MITVISPHCDDAVLSLGQWLATGPGDVEVITVFAGVPCAEGVFTDYDRSCGFTSSTAAMAARRLEDEDALGLLGVRHRHWTFLDSQYDHDRDEDRDDLIDAIGEAYSPERLMFAPLGLGHPDHRFVAECAQEAVRRQSGAEPVGLLLYEELPARVLHPEEVQDRLSRVWLGGWLIERLPWPLPQGDGTQRQMKAKAIGMYASQFPEGADDPCLLVPERCWRVTR